MMWNTGMGWAPWMWLVMGGSTVALWVAVVYAVRRAFDGPRDTVTSAGNSRLEQTARLAGPGTDPSRPAAPLEVLQARLARGEIDIDEYARTRNALVGTDPSLGRDRDR